MILQALTEYYTALLEQGRISPPGWDAAAKVSYGLELAGDGTLVQVIPYQTEQQGKKEKLLNNRLMRVPAHVKRSVGVAANFLCDTSSYLLGADGKGKPERSLKCFLACKELHQRLLTGVDTPAAQAILAFFDHWQSEQAAAHPLLSPIWKELTGGGNLIFCFGMEPVTQDPAIRQAWQTHYSGGAEDAEIGQCLVTGEVGPIARLHPSIKGVRDASTMGASLVSFNTPAFESYGHTQGGNAPVGEYAAFAYTTALNALLADSQHCQVIGDTTVVCWAQHGEPAYQSVSMMGLFGAAAGIDDSDLSAVLHKLAQGEPVVWEGVTLAPEEHFYFLGLAPNAARLSVRFFLRDSFGKFMQNLEKHYQDTAIIRPAYDARENIPLWQLLNETVNQNSRTKAAAPQLTGDVLRAILSGTPYPATLLNGTELRIRAEREVTRGRAAIIKAYYLRLRNPHPDCPKEILQMELNETSTNVAYTLGRMFSVYEQTQQAAYPGINATIKDKYFNAASATPATVFPLLGNLATKHLRVLARNEKGAAVNLEKKLQTLSVVIGEAYPTRLNLQQQGSFQLGYYFENQARYQKKEEK
ncbi:MAG: type I-C CRISPR-associated protein Cas8c/Csd1 [Oscillospiraceae bacterium]|nr:type I-C CRISPR-associated protein Cas8c/Csd1 [Oscillospiraceae bacterium]